MLDSRATLIAPVAGNGATLRALARRLPERYPALFESVAPGPLGRCSLLFGGITASLERDPRGAVHAHGWQASDGGFLANLGRWYEASQPTSATNSSAFVTRDGESAPFAGGWVVLLGYEVAGEIERRLRLPAAGLPFDALALRTTVALVHTIATGQLYAVGEATAAEAWRQLQADVAAVAHNPRLSEAIEVAEIVEEAPDAYLERVVRAKELIAAGEVYQANLSRPWRVRTRDAVSAPELYEHLRRANPAPFAASLAWRGVGVVSSSPERLLEIHGREINTRPIAGTRRRTREPGADAGETRELVAHPKERAEHVMLIDLERNDLGRVCDGGSVEVNEFMLTESYEHVHHIVSNVRGRLRTGVTPIDALRALFPGGTITGCPKVRCMEVIALLEGAARGFYTGSLGYVGLDGRADFNILIRTMTVMGRQIEFRAGAGIVADSVPERELDETRAKARGLLAVFDA
jgi:anthranilate synthase component 1